MFFEKNNRLYPGAYFYRQNGLKFESGSSMMFVSRRVSDTIPIGGIVREKLLCVIYGGGVSLFKNIFNALRISYEGAPTIIGVFLLSFLVAFTAPSYVWISMGLLAFVIFTFRNPDRNDINLEDAIYSPADGRVVDIKEGEWNISGSSKYTRIGIYLSLFNVHVQRIPYSGEIIGISYNKGKKYPAFRKKASMYNESNMVILNTKKGILATKQIAGMITRRIICKEESH